LIGLILPIAAQIHIKALTFFNNICHQGEKNTEKKLARRQLTVKEEFSNSWFICVNKIPRKYDLSFSGRVLVVQEVLRTVIIAPYRKAILVLCRF
jgi:hypothetical protein